MKQFEIMNEKEMYKMLAKIKEYKYIIHEQKKGIMEMETEIAVFKHKESVLMSQQQMQDGGRRLSDNDISRSRKQSTASVEDGPRVNRPGPNS